MLLGSGAHWVLVTDPADEQVLEELWEALTTIAPSGSPVVERCWRSWRRPSTATRPPWRSWTSPPVPRRRCRAGPGTCAWPAPAASSPSTEAPTPTPLATARRLVAGVVAADRVELRPLARKVAPVAHARAAEAPPVTSGLIDGIPDTILAATGPDGPSATHRASVARVDAAEDTGSLNDTTEPDPLFIERIEEGTHTTIRPATPPATTSRGRGRRPRRRRRTVRPAHLPHGTHATVLAVSCPLGHLTSPASPSCRVCHQRVAPQEPRRVPRPTLGGLRLPTGEVVPLDRGVVLGRKPAPLEGSADWPHLVHLPSDHTFVSRRHLHIELDGWQVLARDLDSRWHHHLPMPGREPERMRAGEAYVLEPGATLDLAEVYEVRFEVGRTAAR